LPQHGPAIIVNSFTGQTVVGFECVHAAKWELDSSSRRRKAAPTTEVCATNHDFHKNGILSQMPALHVDLDVRQRLHQLLVKLTDSVGACIVFVPGLIIVTGCFGACPRGVRKLSVAAITQPQLPW
jgi:hypothetical protein